HWSSRSTGTGRPSGSGPSPRRSSRPAARPRGRGEAALISYLEPPGQPVERGELSSPRARQLAVALADSTIEIARLAECRSDQAFALVFFDVEVDVPQRPVAPTRPFERIAVLFDPNDRDTPEALALR